MPKARQVLAALRRDGWEEVRRKGSHRFLLRSGKYQTWAYHDGRDLGRSEMREIAKMYGYTVDELYELVKG